MKKLFPVHPLLFSIYPILALYANNINEITFSETLRSFVISIGAAAILLALCYLVFKDSGRSALLTTSLLILFFSYGHILTIVKTWDLGDFVLGRHRYMFPVWVIVFVIALFWVARSRSSFEIMNRFLDGASVAVLLLTLFSIGSFYWGGGGGSQTDVVSTSSGETVSYDQCSSSSPDIYYIILDGYGRNDVLLDLYDFDNAKLTSFLHSNEFYVADRAYSNYSQTLLSLSSSLNMSYLNYLSEELGRTSLNRDPLGDLVVDSQVLAFLKDRDYRFVTFETGAKATEIRHSDHYLSPGNEKDQSPENTDRLAVNKFEGILIDTTFLILFLDNDQLLPLFVKETIFGSDDLREIVSASEYDKHRERIEYTFSHTADFAKTEGDFFVFAHIIAPHPPFIYGPNGEPLNPSAPFSFRDGTLSKEQEEDYARQYKDQLQHINSLLIDTIGAIITRSTEPPIIIIQGDHGPGSQLKWTSIESTNLQERMAILSAVHLPGQPDILYKDISPVNIFRLLFNCYFDASFDLLSEKHYISLYDAPYDFVDISDELP